jgi:hypothetical protein
LITEKNKIKEAQQMAIPAFQTRDCSELMERLNQPILERHGQRRRDVIGKINRRFNFHVLGYPP